MVSVRTGCTSKSSKRYEVKPTERERVRFVVRNAYRTGRDPVESLDRNDLILTERQCHKVRALAYHQLADDLENAPIAEILKFYGSTGHTAYDAQRCLTEWIRAYARKEEK